MRRGLLQGAAAMFLTACSASSAPAIRRAAGTRPFKVAEVAELQHARGRWISCPAAAFADNMALVTEKEGELWLVDAANGQRQAVAGVPAVKVARPGRPRRCRRRSRLRRQPARLSDLRRGRAQGGTSGAALGYGTLENRGGRAALEKFKVIWRQQPKVSGDGHFAHRIAFGPDGFLYLTSGDRQKFDPAQDHSAAISARCFG